VIFPASTEEVQEIVRVCAAHHVPIIPFGTGTSLEGHVNAPAGGVSIDISRWTPFSRSCRGSRRRGAARRDAQGAERASARHRAVLPDRSGRRCELGGMAATRASGTNAVRYGTMKDNVLALEAVMADGRGDPHRRAGAEIGAGYDLTRLMVGSEGTLGIITELTLRLMAFPRRCRRRAAPFPDVERRPATP
jgi:D-lactate dehydrogenase (cytochrome)